MRFSQIIGQEVTKQQLINSVQEGRIPHAQLFFGQEGVGKLGLAIAYAQYVCCLDRDGNDSCGNCSSCIKYEKLIHPDLHFVFPFAKDGKSKEICDDLLPEWRQYVTQGAYFNLEQWMDFIGSGNKQASIYANESNEIIRKLQLMTYESDYKTMIIWLPEKMNVTCANKLLKILEEPPAKTLFILVSEQIEKIIATILSRTQLIKIPLIEAETMCRELEQKHAISSDNALNISRIANGNYIKALSIIKSTEDTQFNFTRYQEIMRYAYKNDVVSTKKWAEEMTSSSIGREKQKSFLDYAQHLTRECFIQNLQIKDLNYLIDYEENFSAGFARFVNEKNIQQLMDYFANAATDIEQNVQGKFVFFDLGLKLMTQIKHN
jgi:DNA polymerase III subunit delta'